MESRTLLSASGPVMTPNIVYGHFSSSSSASTTIQGYTPAQIHNAYGFNSISLAGAVTADGTGQTIAIVDAYNDPNIVNDLGVFDAKFGLPAANLKIESQTGGSTLPTTDAGWAGEISLDVEWAHAIAPGANILLVEAASATVSDLMTAVNTARHAAGVSVVSMSWGGSEFFSWGGGESQSQLNYDPIFTTPAGHQNVTFIASAGDSGVQGGVQWPASSPNVISVGGTSLTTQSGGTYVSETSWSGTSGGYSQVETQPAYQNAVQNSGVRTVPDVAYNADPNTGFAVYDSLAYQGYVGWQDVGGTSAGAPQWAALIAIADQARTAVGKSTLDGPSQTLPMLYSLYSAPGTSGYSTYTNYFNDITQSNNGGYWFPWGGWGYDQNSASYGYDTITGLGTPHAANIVSALTGTSGSTSTGGTSAGGSGSSGGSSSSGSGSATTNTLPASPLTGSIVSTLPTTAVDGANGSVKLDLTNTTLAEFNGPITVTVYLSSDGTLSSGNSTLATITLPKVKIRAQGTRMENLRFTYPVGMAQGNYYVVASISTSSTTAVAIADSSTTVAVAPATVDLATTFKNSTPLVVNTGGNSVDVTITNSGNVTAIGTIMVQLYASGTTILDSSAMTVGKLISRAIHIRPGHSITLHLRFQPPAGSVSGTYYLIASTTSSTSPADGNSSNDTAVRATA